MVLKPLKSLPRKTLPKGWLEEPRACGARGIYVNCPYFKGCCVRHDADYDVAVIKFEDPEEFAQFLKEADDRFIACMGRKIKRAPLFQRPWLHLKRIAFATAVRIWAAYNVARVKKHGSVEAVYYEKR